MRRVDFYHLLQWPLEQALPPLLGKVLESGQRAVVLTSSRPRAEALSAVLWTFRPDGWLPHGVPGDGFEADQPVWLTDSDDRPNGAGILLLTDGMTTARMDEYDRCLDLFDGRDDSAVEAARRRWVACRDAGWELHYWQQTERGGWTEKASANIGVAAPAGR
ncbi:DNA polymerase III subunit chi [Caenispirillum bisanense]|uniref:DNA polymerase III subunit chi n=1 Tax=Caenispirillum bisanense TaxID=414052 RepID=UPI0031CEE4AD